MAKDERPRQASHPLLNRLEALVGEWEIQVFVAGQPMGRGWARATFAWMEGEQFLVQHARTESTEGMPAEWVEHSPMPLTTIIGLDDSREEFTQLYADARGVFRVYQMSLRDPHSSRIKRWFFSRVRLLIACSPSSKSGKYRSRREAASTSGGEAGCSPSSGRLRLKTKNW